MADIYKKARLVTVWLSPEGNDSNIATAFLQDLVAKAKTGADPIKIKNSFTAPLGSTHRHGIPVGSLLYNRTT